MDTKFIKQIKLTNYKCFNDFEVDQLQRVNLIGGRNNVGKTSFLEACFLLSNAYEIFTSSDNYKPSHAFNLDREWFYFEIVKLLITIQQNRDTAHFLLEWLLEEFSLTHLGNFEIEYNQELKLILEKHMLTLEQFLKHSWWNYGAESITDFRKSSYYQKLFKKNHKPLLNNTTFASSCNSDDLQDMIDELKLNEQYATMNSYIHEVFDIDQIDIIKNKIMLKENGQYRYLSEYGEGTKHFIKTLIILFANPNKTIYFDEIENGIHYSNLDKLWEIILTVSKQQNTQVFATTHSKECIQSYNKVALLLEDNETNYINLSQDKNGSVVAINLDRAMLRSELVQNHEVRAW